MRLVTGISIAALSVVIAALVISIITLSLVLMIVMGKTGPSDDMQAKQQKTNLTEKSATQLLNQFTKGYYVDRRARGTKSFNYVLHCKSGRLTAPVINKIFQRYLESCSHR